MNKNSQSKSSISYKNADALSDGEKYLPGYNKSVVTEIAKFFKIQPQKENSVKQCKSILDFGAGSGSLAEIFRNSYNTVPTCIEIDPDLRAILLERNFICYSQLTKKKFEYIYSSNVLEHIEDDVTTIRMLRNVIVPGGKIAIYVPALPFLFSNLDRKAGHFRRYKRHELMLKFQENGFIIDKCFYNDILGVPASFVLKFLGYRNHFGLGSGRSLIFYDNYIYPISRFLDQLFFRNIIGKNLYLFAHRK